MMKRRVFVLASVLALIAALFTLSAFAADDVRYVANAAKGSGDGSTAENATTLEEAFEYFSENYFTKSEEAGKTCTIYLVEDITLPRCQKPGGVQDAYVAYLYAEHRHPNNPVKIESNPGERYTIVFPLQSSGARYYLLSGDTAFDNVTFRTTQSGYADGVIVARGYKLTIGNNVTVDKQNSTKPIGIVGGHVNYGYYPISGDASPSKQPYSADVTVLSGEFDFISALNRDIAGIAGTTAKLTLGNVKVGTLSATNDVTKAIPEAIQVTVRYTGNVVADKYYPTHLPAAAASNAKAITVNHLFEKGSSLTYTTLDISKVGASELNLYFDPSDSKVEELACALYKEFSEKATNLSYGSLTDYKLANGGTDSCAHDNTEKAYITEPTCAVGGLEYTRCADCYKTLSAIAPGAPDASKHIVDDAAWVDADDGKSLVHKCTFCGEVAESYPVAADGSVAVYVSANGKATGGESAENPINTLANAQDFAAKLADIYYGDSDKTTPVTIYVIGKVDITNGRKVSPADLNKFNNCFEETNHIDHPFVFTSADGCERGELHFPTTGGSTMAYLLYGPTTFENLTFSGKIGGHSMVGRGFKFVLGEGLEMKDIKGKMKKNASSPVEVSDLKLYIVGGWYSSGATKPLYAERTTTTPIDTDLTVLSGEYWFVGMFNRNEKIISDSTGNLTVGSPKIVYLSPVSTGNAELSNVTSNTHYTGAAEINDLYLGTQNNDAGSTGYTNNHFFHPGCEGMTSAVTYDDNRDVVNLYYYDKQSVEDTANKIIGTKVMNETMIFAEYCVVYRGGHTYDAEGVCDFCGVKQCDEHTSSDWVVDVVPTCVGGGHRYKYCTACYEVIADENLDIDSSNHDCSWILNGATGSFVYQCSRCDKILATHPGELKNEVYVSDNGFAAGGFSAEAPINSLDSAYELAVKVANTLGKSEVTIYIVGSVTIPIGDFTPYYVAPSHEGVHITFMGYGKSAARLIYGGHYKAVTGSTPRVEYALGGDTTFDNIEIGSGENTCPIYLTARHNHLTIGERVSLDFRRNSGGGEAHSGALTVVGGCYGTRLGACSKTDTHLTVKSGAYRNIITGSTTACGLENGTCTLELLGNISTRESVYGGSSGGNVGNVVITVEGNVAAGRYFSFACNNGKSANDVTVYLKSGSISSGSFNTLAGKDQIVAPVGCANDTDIMAGMKSLTVYYYAANPDSVQMYRMVKAAPVATGKGVKYVPISDSCSGTADGKHESDGTAGVETPATCFTDGYTTYTCKHCGKSYTVIGEKAAHDFVATHEKNTPADCIHAATTASTCQKCGYTKYEIDGTNLATGEHTYGDDGVCTVCRHSIAADCEHEEFDDSYTETSKCGTVTKHKCKNCGLAITISSVGSHNWGAYTVTVEPTDTAPGIKTRKCKDCGKVETALLYANDTTLATDPVAVDQSGNLANFAIASSKLTKSEKAALNALLQDTAYGSEVKVSYTTDGTAVTNITYSIPLPDGYGDYQNVKVVVKDDDGVMHSVDFKVEKGYIVFTF